MVDEAARVYRDPVCGHQNVASMVFATLSLQPNFKDLHIDFYGAWQLFEVGKSHKKYHVQERLFTTSRHVTFYTHYVLSTIKGSQTEEDSHSNHVDGKNATKNSNIA